jgi:hypothetical protein
MNRFLLSCSSILLLTLLVGVPGTAIAQVEVVPAPDARPSPIQLAATTVGDTFIKVVYGSPRKRDREIFGGLVPYGEVWRTGANEATELLLTGPVMFGSAHVQPGIYSVFTIPTEKSWTIILNSVVGQWGAFSHDPEADVHRITVPSTTINQMHEAFTISFSESANSRTEMILNWDRTEVRIPIMAH